MRHPARLRDLSTTVAAAGAAAALPLAIDPDRYALAGWPVIGLVIAGMAIAAAIYLHSIARHQRRLSAGRLRASPRIPTRFRRRFPI